MRRIAGNFWNIRGDYRIAGILNVGTQMSLVRRANGRFILIDSYDVGEEDRRDLLSLTDGGHSIDAVLNVHPFHTLHCGAIHALLPHARLIGTRRHRDLLPDLPWESDDIEAAAVQDQFADLFEFSIPAGVDFISADERVHVGSVLVRHRESGVVHVDDTLNSFNAPGPFKSLVSPRLRFHPMLAKALEPRSGAADAYTDWARDLVDRWAETPIVCAAHSAVRMLSPGGWKSEMLNALSDASKTLDRHRETHG
ncbi:MBL fold metallo-hydrolase [Stakelama sp. CBK3Z-3]|uniref:MBL fold metallo-hydrolase n=1 Tax=Stakelama flava TaxID=2860338 RepID=A0ABS6XKI5_9SPHN|nr:MBL fold metallo-hydrolase [Stakelama flava]MBW4330328.1 MBL fold metallo-hydrolase [Stakelama flava]